MHSEEDMGVKKKEGTFRPSLDCWVCEHFKLARMSLALQGNRDMVWYCSS